MISSHCRSGQKIICVDMATPAPEVDDHDMQFQLHLMALQNVLDTLVETGSTEGILDNIKKHVKDAANAVAKAGHSGYKKLVEGGGSTEVHIPKDYLDRMDAIIKTLTELLTVIVQMLASGGKDSTASRLALPVYYTISE